MDDHLKIAEETTDDQVAREHNNAADRIQDDLNDLKIEIKEKEEEVGVSTSNDSSKKQKK